jgi:hypothetical protein
MNLHEAIRNAFTVEYIMTPREWLETASDKPALRFDPCYDVIPKTEGEQIVGLWVLCEGEYVPEPITEDWIVAHSTPIHELIRLFSKPDSKPAYLVVNGARVDGIVSRADLNKVARRTYLFTLIGEPEYKLGVLIRAYLQAKGMPEEQVLQYLSEGRQEKIRARHQQMQSENADLWYIDVLELIDIVEIVIKNQELREQLGFSSKSHAEKELKSIERLRNSVAHPVRKMYPVIKIEEVLHRVEQIEGCLKTIRNSSQDVGILRTFEPR